MYICSQRGICSVVPLTLPRRELSRACVYLYLFVLRSPRPCRENTRRGRRERESCGAAPRSLFGPTLQPDLGVQKHNEWAASGLKQPPCHIQLRVRSPEVWSGAHRWHPSVPSAETFRKGSFYGDNNTMNLIWHMTSVSFQKNIYVGFLLTTANLGNKLTSVHLMLNLRIKLSVFIELWTRVKCGSS